MNLQIADPLVFPCKKIKAGKYKYRGWIISCVGYYEPEERCVVWEAYDPEIGYGDMIVVWGACDPERGYGDLHGFSKRQIKRLIDERLSKKGKRHKETLNT